MHWRWAAPPPRLAQALLVAAALAGLLTACGNPTGPCTTCGGGSSGGSSSSGGSGSSGGPVDMGPWTLVGAGDMKGQAEQVFKNLQAALAAAGATFKDVVKMNTYLTDMDKAPAVREVRAKYFTDSTPASTLVQVVRRGELELLLEIEVIAALPAR